MKMKGYRKVWLCEYCIAELRSRGERVPEADETLYYEEAHEAGMTCRWCGEIDDLHGCFWKE